MENQVVYCFFCGRQISNGAERLILLERSMCAFCEKILINSRTGGETYTAFMEKIKKLWLA